MIDMQSSPTYDEIVNFLYEDNDLISKMLISDYQEYLSNIKSKKSKQGLDKIMGVYVKKTEFYKYVQQYFDLENNQELLDSYDKIMTKMRRLYAQFEEEKMRKINNSRWL